MEQPQKTPEQLEALYQQALAMLTNASTEADAITAAKRFGELGNYRDSITRIPDCYLKASRLKDETERLRRPPNRVRQPPREKREKSCSSAWRPYCCCSWPGQASSSCAACCPGCATAAP